jgi:hypothetical protein
MVYLTQYAIRITQYALRITYYVIRNFLRRPAARVEGVAQAVADEVDAEDGQ